MTQSPASERFDVLGIGVDAVTTDGVIQSVRRLVPSGGGYIVFCTVSSVLSARDDAEVHRAIDEAVVVTPDGMPLVWLGRRRATGPLERVYGPDFMVDLIEATGPEFSHYFFGGHDGVTDELVARLSARFPELKVAGHHEPDEGIGIEASESDLAAINASGADLLWVGLGHPKQELWMERNRSRLQVPVAFGVGAAFDFHAGRKKEAPEWMKRAGLQWLHRLVKEPRRLWRRYLIGNSRFVLLLIAERLKRR